MYLCLHVNYTSYLSDFNETWILPRYFRKIVKQQISWKSVKWKLMLHTGGRTDMKLTVALRNFPNALKNRPSYEARFEPTNIKKSEFGQEGNLLRAKSWHHSHTAHTVRSLPISATVPHTTPLSSCVLPANIRICNCPDKWGLTEENHVHVCISLKSINVTSSTVLKRPVTFLLRRCQHNSSHTDS